MSDKKTVEGNCAICGQFGKLSFEHIPPRSAFNDKPTYVQTHEHLVDKQSYLFGKKSRSQKGFGGYTLCNSCNNLTGDWYARDFSIFAHQGMKVIKSYKEPQYFLHGEYKIKPLNVLKQIQSMFMSADKGLSLQQDKRLTEFILNKTYQVLPEEYKVYLYSSFGPQRRMLGYSIIAGSDINGIVKWSEINFPPFGYLLAEDSPAPEKDMLDITSFKSYAYDEEVIIRLKTPYLSVRSSMIGTYF